MYISWGYILIAFIMFALALGIMMLLHFVLIPYFRLEQRRKESRLHIPRPEEIWVQGDDLIYIDAVDNVGVTIIITTQKGQVHKWKENWADWNRRLQNNILFFTGQSRSLGK